MTNEETLLALIYFEASPAATEMMVRNNLFTISSVKQYLSSVSGNTSLSTTQISTSQELLNLFKKFMNEVELSSLSNEANLKSYSDSIAFHTTCDEKVDQPNDLYCQ